MVDLAFQACKNTVLASGFRISTIQIAQNELIGTWEESQRFLHHIRRMPLRARSVPDPITIPLVLAQ